MFHSDSTDSQFAETEDNEEELTLLQACMECDEEAVLDISQAGLTYEQVNERDRSGRTGLSHACANGFLPVLEVLATLSDLDPNLPDNEGNTPLIFAAQAGHEEVVSFLLHHFHQIRIDHCNNLGFTALMKAAIQGRTRCAKLLLYAGANASRRDYGRGLCAGEWARFCGRHECANAISRYLRSKKYIIGKVLRFTRRGDRHQTQTDPAADTDSSVKVNGKVKVKVGGSSGDGDRGCWMQRHLSFRRNRKKGAHSEDTSPVTTPITGRSGSAPLLTFTDDSTASPVSSPPAEQRNHVTYFDDVIVSTTTAQQHHQQQTSRHQRQSETATSPLLMSPHRRPDSSSEDEDTCGTVTSNSPPLLSRDSINAWTSHVASQNV